MVFKKKSLTDAISGEKNGKNGSRRFGKKSKYGVLALILVVIILAIGGAFYMYFSNKNSISSKILSETNLNEEQVKVLIDEIGQKMQLPSETPEIATVTDAAKLEKNDFYRNAQNGDKVLIYKSIKKAILYRPSIGKIIDVATVSISTNPDGTLTSSDVTQEASQSAESLTPAPAQKFKVAVLNSTKESGLAKKGGDLLDSDVVDVAKVSNSVGEYKNTSISKVSSSTKSISDSDLKKIVSAYKDIKAQVIDLPDDETAPSGVDAVIILGEDFSKAY